MLTLHFLGKTYKVSPAVFGVLLVAILAFLVTSVIGLFSLMGSWAWLALLTTLTITVNGTSYALIPFERIRSLVTFVIMWSGFISFWVL